VLKQRLRASRAVRALALVAILAALFPSASMAAQANISGLVPKNGSWANYATSRCTTAAGRPTLKVQAWAGNNADMYFYIRSSATGLAIGDYTSANPRHFPLGDASTRNFGTIVVGTCFKISARKNGFPLASGSETWTGLLTW
jgi:hypothetical protein